jgi:uncharacterized protein
MKSHNFIVKQHSSPHGIVIVITDLEIFGKQFEEGKLQLDLSKEFYKGEEMTTEEILKILKRSYVVHLTGVHSVEIGVDLGIVDSQHIIIIKGIPHAEGYLG